jgi:hypothetical protein
VDGRYWGVFNVHCLDVFCLRETKDWGIGGVRI